jgi:hypothetical protein
MTKITKSTSIGRKASASKNRKISSPLRSGKISYIMRNNTKEMMTNEIASQVFQPNLII